MIKALGDKDPHTRINASEVLGKLGDKRAVEPLIKALEDSHADVRKNASEGLGVLGDKRAVEPLILALGDPDGDARKIAAEALQNLGHSEWSGIKGNYLSTDLEWLGDTHNPQALMPLVKALGDLYASVRSYAAEALWRIEDERAVKPLIEALGDTDQDVRKNAAGALGMLGDKRAVEPLIKALGDKGKKVRRKAAEALGKLGDERAVEPLIVALGDKCEYIRSDAAIALAKLGDERAVEPLIKALEDKSEYVRSDAVGALGELEAKGTGKKYAIEPLLGKIGDNIEKVRRSALKALKKLGATKEQLVDGYIQALSSDDKKVKWEAVIGLDKLEDQRAIKPLLEKLNDEYDRYYNVRGNAEETLVKLGATKEQLIDGYTQALSSVHKEVRRNAEDKLNVITGEWRRRRAVESFIESSWREGPKPQNVITNDILFKKWEPVTYQVEDLSLNEEQIMNKDNHWGTHQGFVDIEKLENGNIVVTNDMGVMRIYDLDSKKIKVIELPGANEIEMPMIDIPIPLAAFHNVIPWKNNVFTVSTRGIDFWDLSNNKVSSIGGKPPTSVAWGSWENQVFIGSGEGVEIYDIEKNQKRTFSLDKLKEHERHTFRRITAIQPFKNMVLVAGLVTVWHRYSPKLFFLLIDFEGEDIKTKRLERPGELAEKGWRLHNVRSIRQMSVSDGYIFWTDQDGDIHTIPLDMEDIVKGYLSKGKGDSHQEFVDFSDVGGYLKINPVAMTVKQITYDEYAEHHNAFEDGERVSDPKNKFGIKLSERDAANIIKKYYANGEKGDPDNEFVDYVRNYYRINLKSKKVWVINYDDYVIHDNHYENGKKVGEPRNSVGVEESDFSSGKEINRYLKDGSGDHEREFSDAIIEPDSPQMKDELTRRWYASDLRDKGHISYYRVDIAKKKVWSLTEQEYLSHTNPHLNGKNRDELDAKRLLYNKIKAASKQAVWDYNSKTHGYKWREPAIIISQADIKEVIRRKMRFSVEVEGFEIATSVTNRDFIKFRIKDKAMVSEEILEKIG